VDGGYFAAAWQNDPQGRKDLYVVSVYMLNSSNSWLDELKILNSGTDAILMGGTHNTVRNVFIDRSYNKGDGGNGYFSVRGEYGLILMSEIYRIRHLSIEVGAKYNVVWNNKLEVDVNFHNGDGGHNLIEDNSIRIPTWRGWDVFSTGGAQYGHKPPGPDNFIVNNKTDNKNKGPVFADKNTVYTFKGFGSPSKSGNAMATGGTFYPMVCR
jgi:hypothetical protein